MAERRMFAKTIIDSDAFLDMPVTARLLYYDLAMRADDDGFVNSPKKIMRMVGASQDDLSILVLKKFIIPFDNGIVVIKHWRIHNYIRKDTYNSTPYTDEMAMLEVDKNKAYRLKNNEQLTTSRRAVDEPSTQVRLGKDSIDKVNKSKRFARPSVQDVEQYCKAANLNVNAQQFVDYYDSNGWKVGKNAMKDWKASCRNWARREQKDNGKMKRKPSFDIDEIAKKAKLNEDYDI